MSVPTPQLKFISLDEVLATVPMSKSNIYRKVKSGEFPPYISFGANSSMFLKHEIEYYLVSLIHKKDCRETVRELMTVREELNELVSYPI